MGRGEKPLRRRFKGVVVKAPTYYGERTHNNPDSLVAFPPQEKPEGSPFRQHAPTRGLPDRGYLFKIRNPREIWAEQTKERSYD